ncbi:MAG TPA: Ig-like domain-containing protein, partial [Patescibacteria group bacterium]|nr:Ig-like domain-containing protein [Patescibacteria group bacterium]
GFTVTGYEVGQGAASDGPFSYTNVGNILTNTVSSLQNGTTYYFVVRALDYFGNSIVTSSVVAATPHVPPSGDSESDYTIKVTNGGVHFIGKTGPGSTVHVVQDGQQSATRVVDGAGNFDIRINDLTPGNYLYALYAIDSSGEKSSAVTFLVTIRPGEITLISGIFIPPTIGLDKSEVKPGDPITFKGETVTPGDVSIHIETPEGKDVFIKTTTDKDGKYTFTLDTDGMPEGSYTIRVRAIDKLGATSPWSITIPFAIGKKTVPAKKPGLCSGIADFNQDCRVDLVDFSILIYWFDRANPPEGVDLNRDRFVNLIDFSIMMYHWTG